MIPVLPIAFLQGYHRARQEIGQLLFHTDRPRPGAASPVRRPERLVQVQMHRVEAQLAQLHLPHQGIHVCPVAIQKPALAVDDLAYLQDLRLKEPQRIGQSQHQRCHLWAHQDS